MESTKFVLTIAYLNTVWDVDEFAMDYTLNIVSKCHLFFIFKHLWPLKEVLEKSWIFLSVKEWKPCLKAL